MKSPRKVVFLDRDGIINEPPGAERYVLGWREFRFRQDALPMLAALFANGYRLVVITNQQGVGKGLIDRSELQRIHDNMCAAIERSGAMIDGVHYCPHLETDGCSCRKPEPGLIFEAIDALDYEVDLEGSWFVGDSATDVQAGQAVGLRTLLLGPAAEQRTAPCPTCTVQRIRDIAETIARRA